jgi:hypothetical protein
MRSAVVIAAAALLLTACPGNQRGVDYSQTGPSHTSTTTANPQAVQEKPAMNPVVPHSKDLPGQHVPSAPPPPIQVQLTEYEIRMPATIQAGTETFHIVDGGHENHNFAIEGNGIAQKLGNDLTRGDTADMTVNLKPGTYTVYCPVDGHRSKGMQRTITVQ